MTSRDIARMGPGSGLDTTDPGRPDDDDSIMRGDWEGPGDEDRWQLTAEKHKASQPHRIHPTETWNPRQHRACNPRQRCSQIGHGTTLGVMAEDMTISEPQHPTRHQSPT
eukprot:CAMPEP_0179432588 /NCGR_PEP_ID=MMETSP0799-20121207/17175_1 /TAXON_ID=46947 /ORGANISM="Geminigera cryophila, Strain CCMP2564" /LENGTH=109 /DNA_ID=CAMNT_0021210063 /DNA_START=880 /DNA_END=1209 /DNA_ORIENTATION=+